MNNKPTQTLLSPPHARSICTLHTHFATMATCSLPWHAHTHSHHTLTSQAPCKRTSHVWRSASSPVCAKLAHLSHAFRATAPAAPLPRRAPHPSPTVCVWYLVLLQLHPSHRTRATGLQLTLATDTCGTYIPGTCQTQAIHKWGTAHRRIVG